MPNDFKSLDKDSQIIFFKTKVKGFIKCLLFCAQRGYPICGYSCDYFDWQNCVNELKDLCEAGAFMKNEILPAYFFQCGDEKILKLPDISGLGLVFEAALLDFSKCNSDNDKCIKAIWNCHKHFCPSERYFVKSPNDEAIISHNWRGVFAVSKSLSGRYECSELFYEPELNFLVWCPDNRFIATISDEQKKIKFWDSFYYDQVYISACARRYLSPTEMLFNKKIVALDWESVDMFNVYFEGENSNIYEKIRFKRVTNFAQKMVILISNELNKLMIKFGREALSESSHMMRYYDSLNKKSRRIGLTEDQALNIRIKLEFYILKIKNIQRQFEMLILNVNILRDAWDKIGQEFCSSAQSCILHNINPQSTLECMHRELDASMERLGIN